MSFVLSECVTELARQMVQLTSAPSNDYVRRVGSQYAAVLPQVTPAAVLMELRGYVGSRFTPEMGRWDEVGQSEEGNGALYKLTPKPQATAVYYFTVENAQVRRVIPNRP